MKEMELERKMIEDLISKKEVKIVLYDYDNFEIESYSNLWDAYRGLKEHKKLTKKYGYTEDYYFQFRFVREGHRHIFDGIKIYVRKDKIYWSFIDNFEG